jgi:hypothetical protein
LGIFSKFDKLCGFVYLILTLCHTFQITVVSYLYLVDAYLYYLAVHWNVIGCLSFYDCRNRHWWWTRWSWSRYASMMYCLSRQTYLLYLCWGIWAVLKKKFCTSFLCTAIPQVLNCKWGLWNFLYNPFHKYRVTREGSKIFFPTILCLTVAHLVTSCHASFMAGCWCFKLLYWWCSFACHFLLSSCLSFSLPPRWYSPSSIY